MSSPSAISISAVLIEESFEGEEKLWAAQCLEYDVAAQAKSLSELKHELQRVLASHLCIAAELRREPFANLPRAPKKYWDMFASAKGTDNVPFRMSDVGAAPEIITQLRVAELV